jgi:hypothetical protein
MNLIAIGIGAAEEAVQNILYRRVGARQAILEVIWYHARCHYIT